MIPCSVYVQGKPNQQFTPNITKTISNNKYNNLIQNTSTQVKYTTTRMKQERERRRGGESRNRRKQHRQVIPTWARKFDIPGRELKVNNSTRQAW